MKKTTFLVWIIALSLPARVFGSDSENTESTPLRGNVIAEHSFEDGFQTLMPITISAPATQFSAESFSTRVLMKNRLTRSLSIQDISKSCRCADVTVVNGDADPGEELDVLVTIKKQRGKSSIEGTLNFAFHDDKIGPQSLTIRSPIEAPVMGPREFLWSEQRQRFELPLRVIDGSEGAIVGLRSNGGEVSGWQLEEIPPEQADLIETGFTHLLALKSNTWVDNKDHLVVIDLRFPTTVDQEYAITAWCFGRDDTTKVIVHPRTLYRERLKDENEIRILLLPSPPPAKELSVSVSVFEADTPVIAIPSENGIVFQLRRTFIENSSTDELTIRVRSGETNLGTATLYIK
ncbi:hypothetical protein N9N28_12455 [Rubripirellula amarantea]|nr:hypothetical protein [Rubripirellula amarantea]